VHALPHQPEFRNVEIVDTRTHRQHGATVLQVIVDRPSGVDLQACERIARRLNAELDRETEPYTLEVESAGLDRPLLHAGDYERFRGQPVRVVTSLPVGGAKTHRGTLFEMLLEALEAALISAYKRNFGGEANAIVSIDRDTGEYKVYHRRTRRRRSSIRSSRSRERSRREVRARRLLRSKK
jgi:ribosome maturation factor RimP